MSCSALGPFHLPYSVHVFFSSRYCQNSPLLHFHLCSNATFSHSLSMWSESATVLTLTVLFSAVINYKILYCLFVAIVWHAVHGRDFYSYYIPQFATSPALRECQSIYWSNGIINEQRKERMCWWFFPVLNSLSTCLFKSKPLSWECSSVGRMVAYHLRDLRTGFYYHINLA